MDTITLSCPSCGGQLEISQDLERFACMYCSNEHLVRRSGGTISLQPVLSGLDRIQEQTSKTGSELALLRLQKEVDKLKVDLSKAEEKRGETIGKFWLYLLGFPVALFVGYLYFREGFEDGEFGAYFSYLCLGGGYALYLFSMGLNLFGPVKGSRIRKINEEIAARESEMDRHRAIVSDS